MKENEIQNEININSNTLIQYDYTGRKVAFENARKIEELAKALKINIEQPIYNKYKAIEAEADKMRARIDELRKMTPDDEEQAAE